MSTGHSRATGQVRCSQAASHGRPTSGTAHDTNMNDRDATHSRVDVI